MFFVFLFFIFNLFWVNDKWQFCNRQNSVKCQCIQLTIACNDRKNNTETPSELQGTSFEWFNRFNASQCFWGERGNSSSAKSRTMVVFVVHCSRKSQEPSKTNHRHQQTTHSESESVYSDFLLPSPGYNSHEAPQPTKLVIAMDHW